jgi:polyhydroxyalkanoate synthesis regulator phasin
MADPKNDPRGFQQSVKEAWLSVLGVFNTAEAEVGKATDKLLESMGIPADANGERHLTAELVSRMKKNREDIERRIDEGVKQAVARVRAPIDKEVATLKSRLEQLQTRFEEMQKRGKRKKDG